MVIRANYKKMNESLKRLYDIATYLASEIEHLAETMDNLQIFWDGYANEEYLIKFDADMGHAAVLLEKTRNTAFIINEALDKYQKCEQEVSLKIKEL